MGSKILCFEQESAFPDPPVGGAMGYSETTMNLAYEQIGMTTTSSNVACAPGSPNCCSTMIPPSQIPPNDSSCWQWWTPPSNGVVTNPGVIPKGCDYTPCQNAVCACDDYCCNTAWDESCRGNGNSFVTNCNAASLCCENGNSANILYGQTGGATITYIIVPTKKGSKKDSKKCDSKKAGKSGKSGKKSCAPTLPPAVLPPGVTIQTNKLNYMAGESIIVTFTNSNAMATAADDWIGIYNCDTFLNIAWQYTGGAQSGSLTFGPGTLNFPYPNGCYFAEYYSYDVARADATFYVGSTPVMPPVVSPVMPPTMPGQATVTTNKSVYNAGEQIMVMFTNPSPMTNDWIGIYRTDSFVNFEYKLTGGGSSGTVSFSSAGYPAGAYFAEYYNGNDIYLAEVSFSVI